MTTGKNTYFHEDVDRGTIRFPQRVLSSSIEEILSEAYKRSFQRKYATICFDFGRVSWCDLLPMTLMANWILSLRQVDKTIEFQFPTDQTVHRFLTSYRFEKFLDEQQVSKSGNKVDVIRLNPNNLLRAPFFPLTFFTEQAFRSLLQDLYYGDRLSTVFAGVEEAESVKTGAVRDVILIELGDNMYVHANGEGAHIAMTKYSRRLASKGANPFDEVESDYFEKMGGQDILEIIISDNGPGFRGTLQTTYIADPSITKKSSLPTDCDLIDYALLYNSSRRSVSERIGRIKDIIESDAIKIPPPTGLYWVIKTVRQYHGLLYVRSGAGICAYDFSSSRGGDILFRSDNLPKKYTLSNLKGVQYRILLPTRKQIALESQSSFAFQKGRYDDIGNYEYISVLDYFHKDKPGDLQVAAEALDEIINSLNTLSTANKGKRLVVVADLQGCEQVSSKAIHYLLYELMQRQDKLQSNVIINMPSNVDTIYLKNVQAGHYRPIQVYDSKSRLYILGVDEEEKRIAIELLSGSSPITDSARNFAEQHDHIFVFDEQENRYAQKISYAQAIRISRQAIGKKLKEAILEQVFDPSIKVLLPSQRYSTGYFETYKIYREAKLYDLLKRHLSYLLIEEPFDYLISIGAGVGVWVDNVLSEKEFSPSVKKRHINLPTSSKGKLAIAPILGIEKQARIVLITDVLGTCTTIRSLMTNISHTEVLKIITIVNAAEESDLTLQFRDKEIKIDAIVRKKLKYYYELPPEWSYTEVHQVDTLTHLLVKNMAKLHGPLLKGISNERHDGADTPINEFFRDIIEPSTGIREGHFYSKSSHIVYLFDIPRINGLFIEQIRDTIISDVKSVENVFTEDKREPITHVFYPHYNPGMDILAKRVASEFRGCGVVKITEEEFPPSLDQDSTKGNMYKAVVLDDATVTGETIFRMIDICERMGFQFIYVYIIIKRCEPYTARRLEKSRQYGRAGLHVRYLMDAELPSYAADKCPLCKDNRELNAFGKMLATNDVIFKHIEERVRDQELQPVDVVLREAELLSFPSMMQKDLLSLRYRWLIECAKTDQSAPAARHALAEVIRTYNSKPSDVLILLFVLTRERIPSRLPDKVRKELFYKSFTDDIISACRYFLKDINKLSGRDLRSVLYVSEEFDPYYVPDNCLDLLSSCSKNLSAMLDLAIHVIRSSVFKDHPALVTNSLQRLRDRNREDSEIIALMNTLVEYCEKIEASNKELKANRLAAYDDLRGGVFHEIQHLRTNLTSAIMDEQIPAKEIEREWESFRIEIDKILSLVKRCIGFEEKTPLCYELDKLMSSINFQLGDGYNIISGRDLDKQVREQVYEIATRITELLFGKDGIRVTLIAFETNIKSIAWAILQQHVNNLLSASITSYRSFPESLCMVYGEENHYKIILHNLIDNVWKWSKGSKMNISCELEETGKFLIMRVLDDGIGLSADAKIGHGLRKVKSLVNRYYGEFEIENQILDKYKGEGYTTSIKLKLPYLRPSEEDMK